MNRSTIRRTLSTSTRTFAICTVVLGVLGAPNLAHAQANPLETTSGLKRACETSPNNRVVIAQDTDLQLGAPASAPELVTTGCTIELLNDAEIEFDRVGMRFAGPLTISGGVKSGVSFFESAVTANAVTINLPGTETYVRSNAARTEATSGNLSITMGNLGRMELFQGAQGTTFAARRAVSIIGAQNFSVSMGDATVRAGSGITLRANGSEGLMKFERSTLQTTAGSLIIVGQGSKAALELSASTLRAGADVIVQTGSDEGNVKLTDVIAVAGTAAQFGANGFKGGVSMSGGSVSAGTTVSVAAAAGNLGGSLVVEKGQFSSGDTMGFVTGREGVTAVKENRLTSAGFLRVDSDPVSGVCEAVGNTISAASQRLCGVTQ